MKAIHPKGKFIVAHVGSIGISNALDIFRMCEVEGTTPHHFLVGDGDLREAIELNMHLVNLSFAPQVPSYGTAVLANVISVFLSSCVKGLEMWPITKQSN